MLRNSLINVTKLYAGVDKVYKSARLSLKSFKRLPPPPHPQARVPNPPGSRGGGHILLRGRGKGEPIWTKGQTLWCSRYCIITLRWWGCEGVGLPSCWSRMVQNNNIETRTCLKVEECLVGHEGHGPLRIKKIYKIEYNVKSLRLRSNLLIQWHSTDVVLKYLMYVTYTHSLTVCGGRR